MKSINEVFSCAIRKNLERGYKTLYIAIDVHGTIFKNSMQTKMLMNDGATKPSEVVFSCGTTTKREFYPNARECLQMLSKNPDIKLILWTSTPETYEMMRLFEKIDGIHFDFLNGNPDFTCNSYADFSKKFCFDVLLDDKAGFDPETDWAEIMKVDFGKLKGDACGAKNESAKIL